jgi:hypothetical protein
MANLPYPSGPGAKEKIQKTMSEFKSGGLTSGSGGKVTDRKQAIAIALSQARRQAAAKRNG